MRRNPEDPVHKDPNAPVDFGGPVVSPAITDPAALEYLRKVEARNAAKLPKYTAPVAGGPSVPIPHLASEAMQGVTMAAQAAAQRVPPEQSIFQGNGPFPTREAQEAMSMRPGAPPPGILPTDILPEQAKQDPEYKEGMGSLYASSQPNLAYRYGVMRGGQLIPPQLLTGKPPGQKIALKPETLKDIETINALQKQRERAENPTPDMEKEAADGVAGAAASYGVQSTSPVAKSVEEAVRKLDDFDYNSFRESMMKDLLNNDDQRKIIESRLEPLNFADLLTKGFVVQRVPVIPGKFEPTFQSMRANEDLAIKRLAMQEAHGVEVSDRYLLDKFSLMTVVIGLRAINGNPMPDHIDEKSGKFDDDMFWKKFEFVTRYPFHMLSSLGVNYFWFDIRIRKLFVADSLKNG